MTSKVNNLTAYATIGLIVVFSAVSTLTGVGLNNEMRLGYSSASAAQSESSRSFVPEERVVLSNSRLVLKVKPLGYNFDQGVWNYQVSWDNKRVPDGALYFSSSRVGQNNTAFTTTSTVGVGSAATGFVLEPDTQYYIKYIYKQGSKVRTIVSRPFYTNTEPEEEETPTTTLAPVSPTPAGMESTQKPPSYGYVSIRNPENGKVVNDVLVVDAHVNRPDGIGTVKVYVDDVQVARTHDYANVPADYSYPKILNVNIEVPVKTLSVGTHLLKVSSLDPKLQNRVDGLVKFEIRRTAPSYGYVNVFSPAEDATVSGDVQVDASIYRPNGITAIKVFVDEVQVIANYNAIYDSFKKSAEIHFAIPAVLISNGKHLLRVRSESQGLGGINDTNTLDTTKYFTMQKNTTPSYGYFSVSAPTPNVTTSKDVPLKVTATGQASGQFNGDFQVYIDGKLMISGGANTSSDKKTMYIDTEIRQLGSQYYADISAGSHTLEVRARLIDLKTYIIGSTSFNYTKDVTYSPSFLTDKTTYKVGESAHYGVLGAKPTVQLFWSSTKNGVSTGEVCSSYGQTTDQYGQWSAYGNAWSASDIGTWVKTVYFGSCDANNSKSYTFSVGATSLFNLPWQPSSPVQAGGGPNIAWNYNGTASSFNIELYQGDTKHRLLASAITLSAAHCNLVGNGYQDCGYTVTVPSSTPGGSYRLKIIENSSGNYIFTNSIDVIK